MAATFVAIDRVQMDALMVECGFMPVHLHGTVEQVFQRVHSTHRDLAVRVYSTIPRGEGVARDCGADAIRVVVADLATGKPVWSATRTHRTQGWRDRLKERMRGAWRACSGTPRCECGRPMVERKTKSGSRFLGCVAFPACKQTRPLRAA